MDLMDRLGSARISTARPRETYPHISDPSFWRQRLACSRGCPEDVERCGSLLSGEASKNRGWRQAQESYLHHIASRFGLHVVDMALLVFFCDWDLFTIFDHLCLQLQISCQDHQHKWKNRSSRTLTDRLRIMLRLPKQSEDPHMASVFCP